jgi:hypothetical protein
MTRKHKGGKDIFQQTVIHNSKNKEPVNNIIELQRIIKEAKKVEEAKKAKKAEYAKKAEHAKRVYETYKLKTTLTDAIRSKKSIEYPNSWLKSNPPLWLLQNVLHDLEEKEKLEKTKREKITIGGKRKTRKHKTIRT